MPQIRGCEHDGVGDASLQAGVPGSEQCVCAPVLYRTCTALRLGHPRTCHSPGWQSIPSLVVSAPLERLCGCAPHLCRRPIEKNQGCMHMTCSQCRHEFCWLCLGAWAEHGERTGGFYQCNKYAHPCTVSQALVALRACAAHAVHVLSPAGTPWGCAQLTLPKAAALGGRFRHPRCGTLCIMRAAARPRINCAVISPSCHPQVPQGQGEGRD